MLLFFLPLVISEHMSSMSLQMQHDACGVPPLVQLRSVSEHEDAAETAMMHLCLLVCEVLPH